EYAKIFEELVKKNVAAYEAGDAAGAASMYDAQGVVIDKKEGKCSYGTAEITKMCQAFIDMGKIEFKMPKSVFHETGYNGFHVASEFESKVVATGQVLKGCSTQLYEKKGDEWKCVYEIFEMH
ncbi:hypothetical protein PFISCL1PPCAC_17901, partial [Pristionchus fissidentatus]